MTNSRRVMNKVQDINCLTFVQLINLYFYFFKMDFTKSYISDCKIFRVVFQNSFSIFLLSSIRQLIIRFKINFERIPFTEGIYFF